MTVRAPIMMFTFVSVDIPRVVLSVIEVEVAGGGWRESLMVEFEKVVLNTAD